MRLLGARLTIVPSEGGGMTGKLTRDMIEAARRIAQDTGAYWTAQRNTEDQLSAYHQMGEELWPQTGRRTDGFVQRVGTAASLPGLPAPFRLHPAPTPNVPLRPDNTPPPCH